MSLAPFGALVITSIIVPRVSFIGHLSGILMGYFMAFVMYPITTNSYCSLVLMLLLLAGESHKVACKRTPHIASALCCCCCSPVMWITQTQSHGLISCLDVKVCLVLLVS